MLNVITTSVTLAFLLTAGTTTPTTQGEVQAVDDKKVLDEIVTDGPVHPELGPQTGQMVFRPVLYLKPGSNGNRIRSIDFYFSPVEESTDGVATLYSEQARSRYRVSVTVPSLNPIGTKFRTKADRIDLGTKTLDLPGGTYVLSEIRYGVTGGSGAPIATSQVTTASGIGSVSGAPAPSSGAFLVQSSNIFSSRSYCLTDETYAFDVQNGQTKFLGGIAMNELPSNRARFGSHYPIIGVDNRLDLVSGPTAKNLDDVEPVEVDLLSFEGNQEFCGSSNHKISALAPE